MEEKTKLISKIEIVNGKSIVITPSSPTHKEWLDKYHLKKIEFSVNDKIELGQRINFIHPGTDYETYYVSNFMYKEDKVRFRINEFEDNTSSVYILPFLGIKKEYLLMDTCFINCYVQHYNFNHNVGEYLYLIYRYLPESFYAKFVDAIQKQPNCINYIKNENDKRFDCFIFKINENKVNDIKLLLKGKYSKITEESKQQILKFHNQTNPESPLAQILYKGHLRKNELEERFGCILPDNIDYDNKPNINEEVWR